MLFRSGKIAFDGDRLEMKVLVKNVGKVSGKEVVQVYVGKPETELEQPEKELVFFEKTKELQPGETQYIFVSVPVDVMTSYSEAKSAYIFSEGIYAVYVGNSVEAAQCGSFEQKETRVIRQVKGLLACRKGFTVLSKRAPRDTWPTGKHSGIVREKTTFLPYQERRR